jgi:hypothetical protein
VGHHVDRLHVPVVHDEPSRALGNEEQRQKVENGRQGLDPQHPAPGPAVHAQRLRPGEIGLAQAQNQEVAEIRGGDADDDVELVERNHAAAQLRRREFRDVDGRDDQRGADTETAQHASGDQRDEVGRYGRENG